MADFLVEYSLFVLVIGYIGYTGYRFLVVADGTHLLYGSHVRVQRTCNTRVTHPFLRNSSYCTVTVYNGKRGENRIFKDISFLLPMKIINHFATTFNENQNQFAST